MSIQISTLKTIHYLRAPESDDSEAEDQPNDDLARGHYESVGKSNLREPELPALDPKYGGIAVTRGALEDEDDNDPFAAIDDDGEDDPFAAREENTLGSGDESEGVGDLGQDVDEDEEIDSEEAQDESDVERVHHTKFRGSKGVQRGSHGSNKGPSDSDSENLGSEEPLDESTDASDVDMDDDASSMSSAASLPSRPLKPARNLAREELRRQAESASTAGLASVLSAGANADVKKGQAVKQQRQTFDRLLDVRIKMQKGITAINELPTSTITDEEARHAARQAEDAALTLWTTIDSIRCGILSAQQKSAPSTTSKRKRPLNPTRSTSLTEIWEHTTAIDSESHPHQRATLDKWHAKTQPILDNTTNAQRSKLLNPSQRPTKSRLTDILDTYLLAESTKLIEQSTSSSSDSQIYDDTPFYQSLLRDLIASRSSSIAGSSTSLTAQSHIPPKLHTPGSNHKKVDTKASKGRKIRYTVHEKLENFTASEDRGTWTESARQEFFGSLFGREGALDERDGNGDGEDDLEAEGEALRLFRN